MKKNILVAGLFAVLAVAVAPKAQAGLLLEPYLGYSSTKVTNTGSADSTNTLTTFGARIGYKAPLFFWFGVDYSMGNGKSKADGSSEIDLKSSDLYAVAGVDFPILVRGWIGYGLMNDSTYSSGGSDLKLTKPTAIKMGLGFNLIPMLSINAELFQKDKGTMEAGGVSADQPNRKDSGFGISVSVPFNL